MRQRENLLKRLLASTVAGFALAAGMAGTALSAPPSHSKPRPLTPGETAMAQMFGHELNPSIVEVHAGPNKGTIIGQAFNTRMIALYGHPYLSFDYSLDPRSINYGSFIHEITHTWQFQTGWTYTAGHCPGGYHYALKPDSVFEDFCSESQAAIVEDYTLRYLKPVSSRSNWYVDMCKQDTPEHDAMLLKVVETRFPKAKEMREKLGRPEQLPDAKPRPPGSKPCPTIEDFTPPKNQPIFFCETLAHAFNNIKTIAFRERLYAWQGFEAGLDRKNPVCTVSLGNAAFMIVGPDDFQNGEMKQDRAVQLAQAIVRYTPHGAIVPVQSNLSNLFNDMVERQELEKKTLREIKSRDTALRLLTKFQSQLATDPSLPPNSRAFVQEKIDILKKFLGIKDEPKPEPQPKPDATPKPDPRPVPGPRGGGTGGNAGSGAGNPPVGKPGATPPRPPAPRPPAPKPPDQPKGPDSNVRGVLDAAFGQKQASPKGP